MVGMKLITLLPYAADFHASARKVVEMEKAGLDAVLVPEAYSFDAISQVGYLSAITERVEIGTGIVNIYSRTPSLLGQTAAGCDFVSGGRFFLGLGASGPQVVEGFHGVEYDKPLLRTREVIDVVRTVVRRETVDYQGKVIQVPLPEGRGTGLGKPLKLINHPVRPAVPIWWASTRTASVRATAEIADGWLPPFFIPELAGNVWGDALAEGTKKRNPALGPLDVVGGGRVAIGEDLDVERLRDGVRPFLALYIGGMGARGKNFYNEIAVAYGFADAARTIQDLYLDGKKQEAEAAVPAELLERVSLIGPKSYVAERLAASREAGVTYLNVQPFGDPTPTIEALKELL
jgi:F420-dependent oxidoreductase-like protein